MDILDHDPLPEPRTPAEFRERAHLLSSQANTLPRHGFTMMAMALREGALEALKEADRLERAAADVLWWDRPPPMNRKARRSQKAQSRQYGRRS